MESEQKNDIFPATAPANSLERELVEKIASEKIKPKPRWEFVFKNWIIWVLGAVSVLLGALAFSSILYLFQYSETEVLRRAGIGAKEFLFFSIPYFWLIFLAAFILAAWYYFHKTENGYRYSLAIILLSSVLASVLVGSVFYGAGLAGAMDGFLGEKAPFYGKIINRRAMMWMDPQSGRLAGAVIIKNSDKEFFLYSRELGEWRVSAPAKMGARVEVGKPVMVIGHKISGNSFEAKEIFFPMSGESFFRNSGRLPPPGSRSILFIK